MTKPGNHGATPEDRMLLPLTFDFEKMLEDIHSLDLGAFQQYNVVPLRSPAHFVDPSIAPPPPAEDYADGSWTEWMDTAALTSSPYLSDIVDTFRKHTTVTLVRLIRLASGAVVDEHVDPTLGLQVERSVIRLTIPILVKEGVEFYLNNSLVPMKPGECWYLRLTDPHRAVNTGVTERINMTIDLVPDDWLNSLVTGFQS